MSSANSNTGFLKTSLRAVLRNVSSFNNTMFIGFS